MFCKLINWKEFSVSLPLVEQWLKANTVNYVGNSTAAEGLNLWFSEKPDDEVLEAIDEYWDAIDEDSVEATSYASQALIAYTEAIVEKAMTFGQKLIREFAAENIRLGITQAGKTAEVRVKMAQVISALSTGSLYDAIDQAQEITDFDEVFVTEARINSFIAKIQAYLAG